MNAGTVCPRLRSARPAAGGSRGSYLDRGRPLRRPSRPRSAGAGGRGARGGRDAGHDERRGGAGPEPRSGAVRASPAGSRPTAAGCSAATTVAGRRRSIGSGRRNRRRSTDAAIPPSPRCRTRSRSSAPAAPAPTDARSPRASAMGSEPPARSSSAALPSGSIGRAPWHAAAAPPVSPFGRGARARLSAQRRRRLPAELIAAGGAVVSELPPGAAVRRWMFPARNRLMAALGELTVVVEAAERSGSLITAEMATDCGRTVAAVPGPVNSWRSSGTNLLLVDGAPPIRGAADVLEHLHGPGAGLGGAFTRWAGPGRGRARSPRRRRARLPQRRRRRRRARDRRRPLCGGARPARARGLSRGGLRRQLRADAARAGGGGVLTAMPAQHYRSALAHGEKLPA